jgi:hypothetical protein
MQPLPDIFEETTDLETRVHDWLFDRRDATFRELGDDEINVPTAVVSDGTVIVVRSILSRIDILDLLQSRKCVCGVKKSSGRSHCSFCYHALPPEKQKALYKRFRAGYEHAFLDSLIYLIDTDRTDADRIRAAVPRAKAAL